MLRGSPVLAQWAHTIIGFFPQGEDASELRFRSRGPRPKPFMIKIGADGLLNMEQPTWKPGTKEQEAEMEIWKMLDVIYRDYVGAPITLKKMTVGDLEAEVAQKLNVSTRTVKKAWQTLVTADLVREEMDGKNKLLYVGISNP